MKPALAALLIPILLLGVLAGLEARATRDNLGQQLPEFSLQFNGVAPECTGKPMLVEFWACSCASCQESVTHLNALYGKFHARGLVVIGVTEDDEANVKAFEKDTPIAYPVGRDRRGKFAASLGIVAVPHALLVDKSGKIVWEGHPLKIEARQLEALVK